MDDIVLPAPICLRKNSVPILREVCARGVITQQQVLKIIPIAVLRDREALLRTVLALTDFFAALNVIVIREQKGNDGKLSQTKLQKKSSAKRIPRRNSSSESDRETSLSAYTLYVREIKNYALLSKEEEIALSNLFQQNHDVEVRNNLVEHNLRLCLKLACRYVGQGVDVLDLVQEGNLGLIRAAELFRTEENVSFSTYAWFWIKQGILRAIQRQKNDICVPEREHLFSKKVMRAKEKVFQELGREGTEEEIASMLDCSVEEINQAISFSNPKEIKYDGPLQAGEDERTGWDILPANSLDPEEIFEAKEELREADLRLQKLLYLISSFSLREELMFRMYYGIGSIEKRTLEEVGKKYGLSRERIRQILAKIWEKLYQLGFPKQCTDTWLRLELYRITELEKKAGIPANIFKTPLE